MSAHTPGPWTLKPMGVIVGGKEHKYTNGSAQSQLAMAVHLNNTDAEDPSAERDANARLIAAAPELLAMLVRVSHLDTFRELNDALPDVRALIAKATGSAS